MMEERNILQWHPAKARLWLTGLQYDTNAAKTEQENQDSGTKRATL